MTIKNPAEWGAQQIAATGHTLRSVGHALIHPDVDTSLAPPQVRRITFSDLRDSLVEGFRDFAAFRDDVIFLCIIYPAAGFVLARTMSNVGLLPLVFPLVAGFALIGPYAAVWLYEMSRRRERGESVSWVEGVKIFASPSAASVFRLGLLLVVIFALWLATAMGIYNITMGPEMPASMASFAREVFTTPAGWALIVVGGGDRIYFRTGGAVDQRRVLSVAARSSRLGLDCDSDFRSRDAGQPGSDAGLGFHRRSKRRARHDSGLARIDRRASGAWPRNLVFVPQGRDLKTSASATEFRLLSPALARREDAPSTDVVRHSRATAARLPRAAAGPWVWV